MSSNFIVEQQDGITTIRLTRRLPLEEFLSMIDDVARAGVGDRRLWDATGNFNFSADEIRQIAARSKAVLPRAVCVAFVAADDLTFGQVRMFEAFREEAGFRTKAFRDEQAARTWLLADPD
ncbi:MAG: hypothetical protein QNJ11_03265 [Woeseiaceae bacterium]|nr:hypothetical protein [Woeseiaceae bacterium]